MLSKAARKPKVVDPEKAKRRMLKRRKLEKRELWGKVAVTNPSCLGIVHCRMNEFLCLLPLTFSLSLFITCTHTHTHINLPAFFTDRDHVKPQFGPLEKKLRRIATRGVVTLFNAVAKQKKDDKRREEEEAGLGKKSGSEALSRMGFLQLLKASKDGKGPGAPEANAASEAGEGVIKAGETPSEEAGWNILKSDYMMNPKLKDWDREVDSSDDE